MSTTSLLKTTSLSPLPFWRQLRWGLILYSVLLAVLPIAIVTSFILFRTHEEARKQIGNQLVSIAELKRGQITRWLEDSEAVLDLLLVSADRRELFINFAVAQTPDAALSQNVLIGLLNDTAKAQPLFEEFFFYNTSGQILASSSPGETGKVVTRQPYFASSLAEDYIQPPYYAIGSSELTMLVTHPMIDQNEQVVGVLAGRLNLETLGRIMSDLTGLSTTTTGETYLVSLENNYLVTPSRFEDEGYILTRAYKTEGINRVLRGENGSGRYIGYRDPGEFVIGAYRWIPELQVGLMAEIEETEALTTFEQLRTFSIVVAVITVLIAVAAGLYSANRVAQPVTTLTQVAIRVTGGDLAQRAGISRRNELGLLATAFNTMTNQLQELIESLEERVATRTRRLEIVAVLGERLSAVLNLQELLIELVNQVKDNFDYYHAHIYLLDEARERLVMAEGTGPAGAEMKAKGHSIPLNATTSLVARAAQTGQIVRVDNVREAEDWLPNPLLPDTYSEMAVPIMLGREGQVVGVLDVQEDKIAGLDEGDASLLRSLANQVAIAIRNARLFEQVETALAEARTAQERYLEQAWAKNKIVAQGGHYLYSQPGIELLNEAKWQAMAEARQQALEQGQAAVVAIKENGRVATSLVAPVQLRDKRIGTVQLHTSKGERSWSEDDLAVIEAVMEQLAQTAENLRLFEETHERASREQTIRDITQKLRQAPNLQVLVETAAQELSQALDVPHSVVNLGLIPQNEDEFGA